MCRTASRVGCRESEAMALLREGSEGCGETGGRTG